VEQIQGDYSPLMTQTVERYRRGQPVLFYTWTPNWTVGTLKPDKDVRWLQVPFASLPEDQKGLADKIAIEHVPGCPRSPCALGFPPNDIRAVANRTFIRAHPDIRILLQKVAIPLNDISRQNAQMIDGEDGFGDIHNHARQWIQANRGHVDRWLTAARRLQHASEIKRPAKRSSVSTDAQSPVLKVVTQRTEPFVIYKNQGYAGFTIELWDKIAAMLGLRYRVYGVNTIAKLMDEVGRGAADVAVSGIGITSDREKMLDFSHTFLVSGLQIMIAQESGSVLGDVVLKLLAIILAPELLFGVGLFLLVLVAAAHINWMFERGHNPQFSNDYARGIWQSIWWAVVTVTTVGYGDKTPTGKRGRTFGLIWMLAGYFVFAYFTATVTSTVTVRELQSFINKPEDLFDKRVATVEKSTAAVYLADQGISIEKVKTIEDAYHLLENGHVDAVVYDAPVLQHYARSAGKGKVKVVGVVFQKKSYGFAFPVASQWRDKINVALLELIENGDYQVITNKWFGN
jgi:ABC-type amino acid transport substrate-binding protein